MLHDLAPHALRMRHDMRSRARHQRETAARSAHTPGLVHVWIAKQRKIMNREDCGAKLPERNIVISAVEEGERSPLDIAWQPDSPPLSLKRINFDLRSAQIRRQRRGLLLLLPARSFHDRQKREWRN
jgi:hypothetical protein